MLAGIKELLGPCLQCKLSLQNLNNGRFQAGNIIRYYAKTHYDTLGVGRKASSEEIKAAFVKQSKMVHPDKNLEKAGGSHEEFVKLNEAYTVLSKTSSRQEYDVSLALYWTRQQELQRSGYHSYTAGSSARPGPGYSNSEAEERVFWDETLYHMRDKSKDQYYEGKPYYGVSGVRRLSNAIIVYICMGLVLSGVVLHFAALSYSRNMNTKILDERDRRNNRIYLQTKKNARAHGNELQLKILQSRFEENPRSIFSPSSKPSSPPPPAKD